MPGLVRREESFVLPYSNLPGTPPQRLGLRSLWLDQRSGAHLGTAFALKCAADCNNNNNNKNGVSSFACIGHAVSVCVRLPLRCAHARPLKPRPLTGIPLATSQRRGRGASRATSSWSALVTSQKSWAGSRGGAMSGSAARCGGRRRTIRPAMLSRSRVLSTRRCEE